MKDTKLMRMKNGQYLTTVPKAWLKAASLLEHGWLNWTWEDSEDGAVLVRAVDYRCKHVFTAKNVSYHCTLGKGHKEWHEYDGIKTTPS